MKKFLPYLSVMLLVITMGLVKHICDMTTDMRSREMVITKLTTNLQEEEKKTEFCSGEVQSLTKQNQELLNRNDSVVEESKQTIKNIKNSLKDNKGIKVTATMYTPSKNECDGDPMVTASGARSTPATTLAVSRDLSHLKGWAVYVIGEVNGKKVNEVMVVQDVMNERYSKRIDIMTNSTKFANNFGVRKLTIIPIKPMG